MRRHSFSLLLIIALTACSSQPLEKTEKSFDDVSPVAEEAVPAMLPIVDGIVAAKPIPSPERKKSYAIRANSSYPSAPPANGYNQPVNRENYASLSENALKNTANEPVSTFSIDVDTGSYSNVRRMLNSGQLPPKNAVRIEELINYFDYDYRIPKSTQPPFAVSTEIAPTPWNAKTKLLHIGIKGYQLPAHKIPPANLVFLMDVSGSMNSPDRLGLVQSALKLLVNKMSAQDKISLVVYAGRTAVLLEPTSAEHRAKINQAIDSLTANGSTNGGAGINLAYAMAEQGFIKGGINRIILATDGDFNVGTVNFESLLSLVAEKRKTGISLTTLGVGSDNYNDKLMEQLADAGNGNHAYLDSLNEAQKVLVTQLSSTLHTIASDVKIQIEFNPKLVSEYRLIGYENRLLKQEDFKNDKVDAGEIGAGHSVTALYEIALKGEGGERLENLRYQDAPKEISSKHNELAFLRLRYKPQASEKSRLLETPLLRSHITHRLENTSDNFRFAAAVAGFGQLLTGSAYLEQFDYDAVKDLAQGARGEDKFGYRAGFLRLIDLAKSLSSAKPK